VSGKTLARFITESAPGRSVVYLCYVNGKPLARKNWQQVYESPEAAAADAVCAALNGGLVTDVTAALLAAAGLPGEKPGPELG
jgi:hypothetical protein